MKKILFLMLIALTFSLMACQSNEVGNPAETPPSVLVPPVTEENTIEDTQDAVETEVNIFNVTFVDHDGSVIATYEVDYGKNSPTPPNPAREGYEFNGWSDPAVRIMNDLVVQAEYSIKTFNVTFVDYDDSVLATYQVNYGENSPLPSEPSRAGYEFDRWSVITSNVTNDLRVIAVYSVIIVDFEFDSETGEITGYNGTSTQIFIPSEIDGVTVIKIGDYAFKDKRLTKVTIPSTVQIIGIGAFEGNQITDLSLSEGLITIDNQAFKSNRLTNLDIPSTVRNLGAESFQSNQLTNLIIPEGIVEINQSVFRSNRLTSVVLPDSLIDIGAYAFIFNQITNVDLPSGLQGIGLEAFSRNSLRRIDIPDSVNTIGAYAFYENNISNITLGTGLQTIGLGAFEGNQIEKLFLPSGIREIDQRAFANNNISELHLPSSISRITFNVFRNNRLANLIIPSNITTISSGAFEGNRFTNITIEGTSNRFNRIWEDIGFPISLMPD